MRSSVELKDGNESFLLANLSKEDPKIIKEKNSSTPDYAASLSKVFLAAEYVKLLKQDKTLNKEIQIKKRDLVGYGTDVLSDLIRGRNSINIDVLTIMGLMIKYSCNSSTHILASQFLMDRNTRYKDVIKFWAWRGKNLNLKKVKELNYFSLQDFLKIFKEIYSGKDGYWDILRFTLKSSRNIYYLFDQQELEILGSKSGTIKIGNIYYVNDFGVFRCKDKTYFMGALVKDKSISAAVKRIRKIGKNLVAIAKKKK